MQIWIVHGPIQPLVKRGIPSRMVKLFELAWSLKVLHHPSLLFRLVFHFIFLHTHEDKFDSEHESDDACHEAILNAYENGFVSASMI
jgi:hypothetical protein